MVWYVWAYHLIQRGAARTPRPTTRLSGWVSGPRGNLQAGNLGRVGWFLLVRAFTPVGAVLALIGLWNEQGPARLALAGLGHLDAGRDGRSGRKAAPRVLLAVPGAGGRRGNRARTRSTRDPFPPLRCARRTGPALSLCDPGTVHLADSGRVGGNSDRGRHRCDHCAARGLGRRSRSASFRSRPPRMSHGVDGAGRNERPGSGRPAIATVSRLRPI